ncbi:MAG: hypothetical protein HY281_11900 [Nitrospirae bacterium]|nr:hypothetical protein [Nitrospirota bacterium]
MRRKVLAPIALFLLLASCGPSPQAGGGIGGTGSVATVASGPVTKFGSVFVSGTEYDNTNTLYCIDHDPCSRENRLKIGMVVVVNGTRTVEYTSNQTLTHLADKITYEETVEGEVQSVGTDGLSLVVLGQVVSVNQKTEIDPSLQGASPHVLNPATVSGTLVEISGFVTGDGTILATLIQPQTGTPHFEIEGVIKNHDHTAKTFAIGSLVVDYSRPTTDISLMPSPTSPNWDGLVVFVLGDRWSPGGSGPYGARMSATSVKPKALGVTDIQDTDIEDFVTRVDGPGDFFLNNVHVRTSSNTTFEGGTLSDIVVGSHLEVNGPLIGGTVTATKVAFEGETELQANVAAIDSGGNTLTLTGLAGLIIQFDSHTRLDGQGSPRRLDDLHSGDHLSIHGQLRGGNVILATEVERSDPKSNVQVQGFVTSAADPIVVLLGASIDTSSIPEGGFLGRYGTIGRRAFFDGLSSSKKVTLRGTYQTNTVTWSSASRGD